MMMKTRESVRADALASARAFVDSLRLPNPPPMDTPEDAWTAVAVLAKLAGLSGVAVVALEVLHELAALDEFERTMS